MKQGSSIAIFRTIVWKLLTMTGVEAPTLDLRPIQKEACHVIANGLLVMYPTSEQRAELMRQLLREGMQL